MSRVYIKKEKKTQRSSSCCFQGEASRASLWLCLQIYCKLPRHCTKFLQIYRSVCWQKGPESEVTTAVKNPGQGRLGEAEPTVRNCGSTGTPCCDISHHCQFSRFRVGLDIHHQLTWETRGERGRIGIFMDKGSQTSQLPGVGVSSLATLLLNDRWRLALVSKTRRLCTWQRNIHSWNYTWRVATHCMS